jgi:Bacterial Ig-like domain
MEDTIMKRILLIGFVVMFLFACNHGGGGSSTPPPPILPTVVQTIPASDAKGVSIDRSTPMLIKFSEPVSFGTGTLYISNTPVSLGTSTAIPGGQIFIVTPTADLSNAQVYTWKISGAKSLATGNVMADYSWSFTTGLPNRIAINPGPIPIGVSVGNIYDPLTIGITTAGTFGAVVSTTTGSVFALSNNHVFASVNQAPIGTSIVQPGTLDGVANGYQPTIPPYNLLGVLSGYVPISCTTGSVNYVDAAVSTVLPGSVSINTLPDGYGSYSSTTLVPSLGQPVQKYGRTTSLTKGKVVSINGITTVSYSPTRSCIATFIDQIEIETGDGYGMFGTHGDSGSLIVTDDSNHNPIGLLFAGGGNVGTYRIFANKIDNVLKGASASSTISGLSIVGNPMVNSVIASSEEIVKPMDENNTEVKNVMDIQNRHTDELMKINGVVGTATGLTIDGKLAVVVYVKDEKHGNIPDTIEGIPVVVKIVGEIKPL